ncbi:LOW QUALITY PROTEIN: hypothetical protein Cgig2_004596 [Carnegiea gigantea]|uniref:Endonuclease/exonuclease/phosphatase domain-containing protein n=1 Tax=Carnegiea gigantea TaxID=171969 RepID=A0A9Q1GI67_9CARY|nr:LOW QUALITY PROTEIN: hypothetical protein Cgig2_004596 [Carnegiea gigantea]
MSRGGRRGWPKVQRVLIEDNIQSPDTHVARDSYGNRNREIIDGRPLQNNGTVAEKDLSWDASMVGPNEAIGEETVQPITKHVMRHQGTRIGGQRALAPTIETLMANTFSALLDAEEDQEKGMGGGGRVIVSWHPRHYNFNMVHMTDQLIHGELSTNTKFLITFIYGRNLEEQRSPLWDDIRTISHAHENPWSILGDFNAVLHQEDRIGGVEMERLKNLQNVPSNATCKFQYERAFFTWTNKTIWSKIDRAFYNELWYEAFTYTHVHILSQGLSDQTPMILSFPPSIGLRAHSFSQVKAREDLVQAQSLLRNDPLNIELQQRESKCRDHYTSINHSAISLMKQQCKAKWIGLGDESTRTFMARIKQRKAMASIYHIKDLNDHRVEGFEAVSRVMIGYYQELLGNNDHHRASVEDSKIKTVIFSIPNHKSPGPDGYPSGFYKACW